MSVGQLVFSAAASAMIAAILLRAVQTYRAVARFRARWPELSAEHESLDVEAVRRALMTRRVSFLVPAWNEREALPHLMADLASLPLPNLEVFVSAGGDDGTLEVAREHAGARPDLFHVLEQSPGVGKQRALRQLFAEASGAIIYLTDADCRLTVELVAATLAPLLFDGEVAATTGGAPVERSHDSRICSAQLVTYLATWLRQERYTSDLNGQNAVCDSGVLKSTRALFVDAPIGTDVALARALTGSGHRIRFVALPMVETEFASSLGAMARQLSRWTRNAWYHDGRAPLGQLLLTGTWWAAVVLGAVSYLPLSLSMIPLAVGYVYALHPGLFVVSTVYPQLRVRHAAFIAVALLHQVVPLLAVRDYLSRRRRERW